MYDCSATVASDDIVTRQRVNRDPLAKFRMKNTTKSALEVFAVIDFVILLVLAPRIYSAFASGVSREVYGAVIEVGAALLVIPAIFAIIWLAVSMLRLKDWMLGKRSPIDRDVHD
ncbi:MAG: hypothetical protein U0992_14940 [Planctomycetaceae bacterium]